MRNWRQTVQSEYASSQRIMSLLAAIEAWLSPDANYENFYTTVWNIETAVGYGLDVLGRIANIPRTVALAGVPTFGFGEAGDRVGFGQGPFFEGGSGATQNFELEDPVYRLLVLAKAAFNITNGSVQAINAIMMNLFPNRGNCYVTDGRNAGSPSATFGFGEAGDRVGFDQGPFGDSVVLGTVPTFGFGEAGDRVGFGQGPFFEYSFSVGPGYGTLPSNMSLAYVFQFTLQPFEEAIAQSGALPKPTGVTPYWSFLEN